MPKFSKKILSLSPVILMTLGFATGCSSNEQKITIRVLNSADYIYESSTEEEREEVDYLYEESMMQQFVEYMNDKHSDKGIKYDFVYDTFDTQENLYNELMTGKSSYDIINASDYMIQKLISSNLIQTLSFNKETYEMNEYTTEIRENVSDFLWDKFDHISPKNIETDERMTDKVLSQYAVPYMWGTIGITYNPSSYKFDKLGYEIDDFIELFSSWDSLYSEATSNAFSIKDSVRDTYAVSIVHAMYEDKILPLEEKLEKEEITPEEFNKQFTEIFNMCDDETLRIIQEDMLKLKANAFGFEVDSGKTDMVVGKIGANVAWSGDALWAIQEAEDDYETELYFSVPEEGSNIWFDAWAIPTNGNLELGLEFIDFMCREENAIQNTWSVMYTPSTASEEILNYYYDYFDVRGEIGGELDPSLVEGEDYIKYDLRYFFGDKITNPDDAILYADTYYVDRQLTAAFPSAEMLPHLCVMDDFGKQNIKVLDMWENVRTNALPIWAVILFIIEGFLLVSAVCFLIIKKGLRRSLQKRRHKSKVNRS